MQSIVMQIYDRFNRHPVTDTDADYSRIGRISIASSRDTYRVVAYPGGTMLGLNIDITAPGGIFSPSAPLKTETSPNFGVLSSMYVPDEHQSVHTIRGTMNQPPAAENLLLPGDEGFDLFTALHTQIGALQSVVADTIATTGARLDPTHMQMNEESGIQKFDPATDSTTHYRIKTYEVRGDSGTVFEARLNGSVITPGGIKPDTLPPRGVMSDTLPVFREGTYSVDGQPQQPFSLESLVAFSGLQIAIDRLYV